MKRLLFWLLFTWSLAFAQNLRVHFIDVGQGDGILVQYMGHNYTIDAGKDRSDNAFINYLHSVQADTLDCILATHPDADHYGEYEDLIQDSRFTVREFVHNQDTSSTQAWQRLINLCTTEGIPIRIVDCNDDLDWSIPTDILSPNYTWGYSDTNLNSITMMMTLGNIRILFLADSETGNNNHLLQSYNLNAQVLKVSHHGAANGTNADLLAEVQPLAAIISSGNNSYGHPAQTTINLLNQYCAGRIYSTADDWNTWYNVPGANGSDDTSVDDTVVLETNGNSIWINNELIYEVGTDEQIAQAPRPLRVYPQPFIAGSERLLHIDTIPTPSLAKVALYDVRGRQISSCRTDFANGKAVLNSSVLGLDDLSSGVYFLQVSGRGKPVTTKLLLLH